MEFEPKEATDYWLFQGNPELYDFPLAVKDDVLDAWRVTAHRDEIKMGDKVIIWLTGRNGGVGGLAEVDKLDAIPRDTYCWKEKGSKKNNENNKYSVGIKITTNKDLFTTPLKFNDEIKNLKLNVGRGFQNINYKADENQYEKIGELINQYLGDSNDEVTMGLFPEGNIIERIHRSRERNVQVIQIAKDNFRKKYGKLFCQICHFDFEKKYGTVGRDFIEGHHTVAVSEMKPEHKTKPEDIALLCANCHRMIHKKRPWLTMQELSKLLE